MRPIRLSEWQKFALQIYRWRWEFWAWLTVQFAVAVGVSVPHLMGCTPPPPTPHYVPLGDASDQGAQVCNHLEAVGCAQRPNCADTVRHVQAQHLVDLKIDCLLAASSASQAQACGAVTCL